MRPLLCLQAEWILLRLTVLLVEELRERRQSSFPFPQLVATAARLDLDATSDVLFLAILVESQLSTV